MRDAIGRVVSILSIPYGFTVTLWCSGALAVVRFGRPGPVEVLLFATGAASAFIALAIFGWRLVASEVPMRVPSVVVMNGLPVVVVLIVALLATAPLGPRVGFLASGVVATGAYILGVASLIRVWRVRSGGASAGGR